ncbi:MAG: TIGR04076 family protein [Syntrophaceae bacterium]|nr:TIGR04076 family protein [Syntrophaceae bacterium]
MSSKDTLWENQKWQIMQNRLGYNDEEMRKFRDNPRNEDILSRVPELINKTIIAEVVDSHGCNSQHKVGDKFYFDSAGNLLTALSPKRICVYALSVITLQIFAATEFLYAGVDPNQMRFKRAACFDVGIACGGWGRVVLEIRVEDRKKN